MSTPLRTSLMLPVEHAAGEDIAARFAGMLEVARLAEQGGIDLAQGRFIIGDPAYVTERILEYRETLGMTMFGLRMHWVGMPHALNLKSLGLFCDKVLPALHR